MLLPAVTVVYALLSSLAIAAPTNDLSVAEAPIARLDQFSDAVTSKGTRFGYNYFKNDLSQAKRDQISRVLSSSSSDATKKKELEGLFNQQPSRARTSSQNVLDLKDIGLHAQLAYCTNLATWGCGRHCDRYIFVILTRLIDLPLF
jgi:hypothetical protein